CARHYYSNYAGSAMDYW
nr:immunoglobulin heavy chain junction region [Mus musculus]